MTNNKKKVDYVVRTDFQMPPARLGRRPFDPAGGPGSKAPKYPFANMAVGETALFNTMTADERYEVRGYLTQVAGRRKLRFITRTLADGTFAVQRIADDAPKMASWGKPATAAAKPATPQAAAPAPAKAYTPTFLAERDKSRAATGGNVIRA